MFFNLPSLQPLRLIRIAGFVLWLPITPAALSASLAAQGLDFARQTDGVKIHGSGFEAIFANSGAGLTIQRGEETVLRGWAASEAGGVFDLSGGTDRIGGLQSVSRSGDAIILDYATETSGALARIEVRPRASGIRVEVRLLKNQGDTVPGFAWELAPTGLWFGGGFQGFRDPQVWPLNQASIVRSSFLASSLSQATPLWYTTKGIAVWVRTPLDFRYSVNRPVSGGRDGLLALAMPRASALEYDIIVRKDFHEVVRVFLDELARPCRRPPREYFESPVYISWVEFKTEVDQAKLLDYARSILAHGLPAGVIELDDNWEVHYGDMEFDARKFPDPRALCDELHRMGFRVTLWVHPFVNADARTFAEHQEDGLLLRDANRRAALISWWNGVAAVWDFTNPQAGELFRHRLDHLKARFGFDGFKFDGGDAHFVALDARPARPLTAFEYPDLYNAEATAHYAWNETRVGIYSQSLGIVQRLQDKNSVWGQENGLGSLVPEALTTSLRGYFYLLPDIVGGNQYGDDRIEPELLIRWAQAVALMPLLQFSSGPWHYGPEALHLCREAVDLHRRFAPYFVRLADAAMLTGEPIIAPLAYHFPDDPATFSITDQFIPFGSNTPELAPAWFDCGSVLARDCRDQGRSHKTGPRRSWSNAPELAPGIFTVGPDVIVAPVLTKGAVARNLYLPRGHWRALKTGEILEGGRWLNSYPAPLDTLPVFVREGASVLR